MHIFTSPNTCIQIITHVFSHHHIHISVPHFVGVFVYADTINRSPTAADGLPKQFKRIATTMQTGWHNVADDYKKQKGTWQKTTYLP